MGADMTQRALGDVTIVEADIALEGIRQVLPGTKAVRRQDLGNAPVEALDHAVGLRMMGPDQAVLDRMGGTLAVKGMLAGGVTLTGGAEAVGKLLAVVGKDRGDLEGRRGEQMGQEALGAGGGFFRQDLDIDPARGPVDGGEQVSALGFIGHQRQILDVDMNEARHIILKGFRRRSAPFRCWDQRLEVRHPMAAQAAIETRAGHALMDEFPGHREEVIQGQQERLAQRHDDGLLGRRERGVQPLRAVGTIPHLRALPPFAHGGFTQVVTPGQFRDGRGRFAQLAANRRGGTGILMEVELHRSALVITGKGHAEFRFTPDAAPALGGASGRPPGSRRLPPGPDTPKPRGRGTKGNSFSVHNHTGRDS